MQINRTKLRSWIVKTLHIRINMGETIDEWADNCFNSRFYSGLHWESTNIASKKLGEIISEYTFEKLIKLNIIKNN